MAKGKIMIKTDRCKGCELCISVCPKKILKINEAQINIRGYHPASIMNEELCIACANCAVMCPDGSINVYAK